MRIKLLINNQYITVATHQDSYLTKVMKSLTVSHIRMCIRFNRVILFIVLYIKQYGNKSSATK